MNFGACVVNVSDDRPSEPENGESTDYWHLLNHKQNSRRGRRSLSSLMKGTFYIGLVQCVVSYSSILIFITHPPTPLIDPAKAGSISGSWEPEPSLGFAKNYIVANCSSFTWVGNGEARSVGDK
jgi:hypothetical protein